jgi:hypothetical protein
MMVYPGKDKKMSRLAVGFVVASLAISGMAVGDDNLIMK